MDRLILLGCVSSKGILFDYEKVEAIFFYWKRHIDILIEKRSTIKRMRNPPVKEN